MSSHAAAGHIDHHHDPSTSTGIPNKKLMMWAFLASDCMFFGTLISTHLVYRQNPPEGTLGPKAVFSLELTSFSTFILLMSSLMMALAVSAIQRGNLRAMRRALLTTIFFGLVFLWCQVYEFNHFVHEKGMLITKDLFGMTFYTLTGTHGTHVAIGVLWLVLMYIRSFKPARSAGFGWAARGGVHFVVFAVTIVALMNAAYHAYVLMVEGQLGTYFATLGNTAWLITPNAAIPHWLVLVIATVGLAALAGFARPRGEVDFTEANAIDVESMGLYWHFVDIVWIVIFTVVYLLEYVV